MNTYFINNDPALRRRRRRHLPVNGRSTPDSEQSESLISGRNRTKSNRIAKYRILSS